jgi:hypothetical protein
MSAYLGKVLVASTLAVTTAVSLSAPVAIDAKAKVKLNKTSYEMKVGDTFKLKLKGAKAVAFGSSDTKIAKVSSKGKVKAKKAGTATITVTGDNGKTYTCKITVVKKNQAVVKDDNIDLGGMNIIIRDWWSPNEELPTTNDYEYERKKYLDDIQEKYNFTIKEMCVSDWGTANTDFINYVLSGGDDNNYVFALHTDASVGSAVANGLMYDLSKLDCLDFSAEKFARNKLHEQFTLGNSVYAFFAGYSEPGTGVYFNKQVLKDAGIDPDSIYDLQKNGKWTWDKFEELMEKCQRDTDGDGKDDIYGLTLNETYMTNMAVLSNGGSYVSKDKNGKFVYNLESKETMEALKWCVEMYTKYDNHDPEDAGWDYYVEEWKSGNVAFMVDQEYINTPGNQMQQTDFEVGFVMFPKGPQAKNYVALWNNNPYVIPACYDADRAWKIAFAWNKYTEPVPGYEDYNKYLEMAAKGNFDKRALSETIPMMEDISRGVVTYQDLIPQIDLGADVVWNITPDADVYDIVESARKNWKEAIKEANSYIK